MRIEIILFLITGFLIGNIYTDGKYLKLALSWKKYYQMAGIVFGALFIYWLVKKNPIHAKNIIMSSNEYIKYLPVDRQTTNMLSPILDFTAKWKESTNEHNNNKVNNNRYPILTMPPTSTSHNVEMRKQNSQKIKRSVSETKKKFVASSQNWLCASCKNQLDYTFEVDHTLSLEHGGTNDINNLRALCPSCHRKKTSWENMI
jgi:hypothetical protein